VLGPAGLRPIRLEPEIHAAHPRAVQSLGSASESATFHQFRDQHARHGTIEFGASFPECGRKYVGQPLTEALARVWGEPAG
jgi:hypothetical protein